MGLFHVCLSHQYESSRKTGSGANPASCLPDIHSVLVGLTPGQLHTRLNHDIPSCPSQLKHQALASQVRVEGLGT